MPNFRGSPPQPKWFGTPCGVQSERAGPVCAGHSLAWERPELFQALARDWLHRMDEGILLDLLFRQTLNLVCFGPNQMIFVR
jgi:hypothetical protein